MMTWSYEAFESMNSGREGVTEMELRVRGNWKTLVREQNMQKLL